MADVLQQAVDAVLPRFFSKIETLRKQQLEILNSLFLKSKDTLAILSTGHGKSLPFQISPFIVQEISSDIGQI